MPSRAGPGGRLAVDDYQRAYDALILSRRSASAGSARPDSEESDSSSEEHEFLVGAQQYAYVRLLSYRMYGEQGWIMSDIARDGDPDWIALAQAWEGVLEQQLTGAATDAETAIGSDSGDSMRLELDAGRASRLFALLESVLQEYDTAAWNARFPGFASTMYSSIPQLPPLDPAEDSTQSGDQSQSASAPPSATSHDRAQTPGDQDLALMTTTSTAMLAAGYEYDPQSRRTLSQSPRRVLSPLADADATPAIDGGGPAKEAASLAFAQASVSVGDAPKNTNRIRGRTGTQSSIETKVGSPEPALLAQYKSAASVKDSEDDRRILLWKWMHGAKDPVETPQFELPIMNTASFARPL